MIKLKGKQHAFLLALLQTQTTEQAIEQTGISRRTAYDYLKDDNFNKALREARTDAVKLVSQKITSTGEEAMTILKEVLHDKETPAHTKMTAVRTVLEYMYRTYENDELERRIEELEQHVKGES